MEFGIYFLLFLFYLSVSPCFKWILLYSWNSVGCLCPF
jgi:hypothetical protein